MRFTSFFVSAAFACVAVAQSIPALTSFPTSLQVGVPTLITWIGGDPTAPYTLTLVEGPSGNLKTVLTITSSGTGGSFSWTPTADLVNGNDYAFEITQAGTPPNYGTQFSITGGSTASASVSLTSTSSAISSSSSPLSSPISSYTSSSLVTSTSSLKAAVNITSTATTSTTRTSTSTTTSAIIGTGTGTGIARNATLSSATLSATGSSTFATISSLGSSTSSAAGSNSTKVASTNTNAGSTIASPLALILGILAAFVYLN